jgi:pimeloyl-ACP methyl ester carboxylesterase
VVFIRGTGAVGARWAPQVEAYKEEYDCIIFDNRGVGGTDVTPAPYTVAGMAADTLALLDALDLERVHLSGGSLGGAIAQRIAIDHPERLLSLQLHGTWARTAGWSKVVLSLFERFLAHGGINFYYEATIPFLLSPQYVDRNYDQVMRTVKQMQAHAADSEGLRGQLAANLSHDILAELHAITVPTLITVGEWDVCFPPSYAQELHHQIRGSELVIFPAGGHLQGMQNPAEFNTVTLDFLRRHPGR